ncbi:MAG: hypothetical protein A2Y23_06305 [Clostridiales bacterium GWB2_37_7]|nr:MAG: hypothetical protein A2Y23_06305 [Clostridiales bacterium GWB2_37_7]
MTKFDRMQIAYINNTQAAGDRKNNVLKQSKSVAVPHQETFKYVFDNAKKGNEFAAVLLDEWQNNCLPKNEEEKQVVELINKATNKIFK